MNAWLIKGSVRWFALGIALVSLCGASASAQDTSAPTGSESVAVPEVPPATASASPDTVAIRYDGDYGPHSPPLASERGARIDRLLSIVHIFMFAIFIPWFIFFVYCLVKFRAKAGHRANTDLPKAKLSKYAEIFVAVFEVVLLLGFSMPIWAEVKNPSSEMMANAVHLRCIGEQFQWHFHYPGADGVYGRTDPTIIDPASNPVGIDRNDPKGVDDFVSTGEFHFPVDRGVQIDLTSKDVIHSLALPVLRVKQDAIPGMMIPVTFDANKTGRYQVACAQLCGNNHFKMFGTMVIETPEQYDAWVAEKAKGPELFEDD